MIQAFFFDLQAINAGKLRPQGIEPWKATKVAVLGAGMMGAGIAYSCARAGMEVVLKDVSAEAAAKGKGYSEKLNEKAVSRGKLTQEKSDELLARITPTDDYADLAGCDLVIEAVFEDPSLKHEVFAEAAKHVSFQTADYRSADRAHLHELSRAAIRSVEQMVPASDDVKERVVTLIENSAPGKSFSSMCASVVLPAPEGAESTRRRPGERITGM